MASPDYLEAHGSPQSPHDLVDHASILLRLPTSGGLYPWTFAKDGEEVIVRPKGHGIFNTVPMMLAAALDGIGLASLPEAVVAPMIADGRLVRVLAEWTPKQSGYHLYYPSRKQPSAAFSIVLDALRKHRARASTPQQ